MKHDRPAGVAEKTSRRNDFDDALGAFGMSAALRVGR